MRKYWYGENFDFTTSSVVGGDFYCEVPRALREAGIIAPTELVVPGRQYKITAAKILISGELLPPTTTGDGRVFTCPIFCWEGEVITQILKGDDLTIPVYLVGRPDEIVTYISARPHIRAG